MYATDICDITTFSMLAAQHPTIWQDLAAALQITQTELTNRLMCLQITNAQVNQVLGSK